MVWNAESSTGFSRGFDVVGVLGRDGIELSSGAGTIVGEADSAVSRSRAILVLGGCQFGWREIEWVGRRMLSKVCSVGSAFPV